MTPKELDLILFKLRTAGLKYPQNSLMGNDTYVFNLRIGVSLRGNWKRNVIGSLNDLIALCKDYIDKLEENR